MAKFTITSCTRLPRQFHEKGESLPWYHYIPGRLPAEYRVHLIGTVSIGGVDQPALGTFYTAAGAADENDEIFTGLKLPFFPDGSPKYTLTAPPEDDPKTSAPIYPDGKPRDIEFGGKSYKVPLSAVRAVYTVRRFWIEIDADELIVKSRDGQIMRAKDGAALVRFNLKSDLMPRLRAPIEGFVGVEYEDKAVNDIRVANTTKSIDIVRGKVSFKK